MRVERATLSQVWAHMAAKGWRPTPYEYALLVHEVMAARVWVAIDHREVPVALGGLWPSACRTMTGMGWLSVLPAIGLDLLPLVRGVRRVLLEGSRHFTGGLECGIRDDNPMGMRLGLLCGFVPTPECLGVKRYWRWSHGRICRHHHGRQRAA